MIKFLISTIIILVLSGCTVTIQDTSHVQYRPVTQVCYWVDAPVYGYADVYRDRNTTVRIKQTAFVDRQWRCN